MHSTCIYSRPKQCCYRKLERKLKRPKNPALMYGLLDFVVNRFFMKLLKTNNRDIFHLTLICNEQG